MEVEKGKVKTRSTLLYFKELFFLGGGGFELMLTWQGDRVF